MLAHVHDARAQNFLSALESAVKHNTEIVVISQCIKGSVDWRAYVTGMLLRKLGMC